VNYLVRKAIYSIPGSSFRREDEIVKFLEIAPGIFFPVEAIGTSPPDSRSKAKLLEIKVNQPLPPSIFKFSYPRGVYFGDSITGTQYRVDSEGNAISKKTPLGTPPPPPAGELPQVGQGMESQGEPESITRWILPVSVMVLVLAGGFAVLIRLRKHKSVAST